MLLIKQFDDNDCGAACIAMICNHYKSFNTITHIRQIAGTDTQGTSLKGLVSAGKTLGFDTKAVKGNEQILVKDFPVPFIAHVKLSNGFNHFIVVYKISKNHVYIADPAGQKIKYKKVDFLNIWTGYLVLFAPTPNFKTRKSENVIVKFLPLIKPHIRLILLMFFVSALLSTFGILTGLYFQFFVDDIIGTKSYTTLHTLSFALIMLSFFSVVLSVIRSQFLRIFTLKTNISLSVSYIKHILNLPLSFFDSRKTGEILSRFDDSEKVRSTLSNVAFGSVLDFVIMIFVSIYLAFANFRLFCILLISATITSLIVIFTSRFFGDNYKKQMQQLGETNSLLIEILSGMDVVKSLNAQEYTKERYEKNLVKYIDLGQKSWNFGNLKELFTLSITKIGSNLIFWIGGYLILQDTFSLGQLISFNTLATFFIDPLSRFIDLQPQIQETFVAAERISEILDMECEQLNSPESEANSFNLDIPIEFKNITFRYGIHNPIFENFNLNTGNNKRIAFVGASGCGKSTIMKLLLNFYQPENGEILINHQNINNMNIKHLRNKIGYVPQEVYLFSGSIYENITMGRKNFTLEDVIEACKKAQANFFIENLPDKYYAKLNERGSNLSGGERQRIALARALLSKPKILLLDEATSALDTYSEREFQKVVDDLGTNEMITITIAHRLSTIVNSDVIFVMDKGNIIEQGNHEELLKQKGLYYKLWNI